MDSYQPIYDAVRSKISGFDGQALMERIVGNFDISHYMEILKQDFSNVAYEMQRPSVIFKPTLRKDGDQWCALYGDNLQDGVGGFGNTPDRAMLDFDNAWHKLINGDENGA